MVAASLVVLLASMFAAWSLIRAFGPAADVKRLQITDSPAPSIAPAPGVDHVWLEVPHANRITTAPSTPPAPVMTPAPVSSAPAASDTGPPASFHGRPLHAVRTIRMLVTAYCPCSKCCGKHANGRTAAGYSVWTNRGKLVAADTRILPFGSLVRVPGYDQGHIVPVLDRGGRIKGRRLDVLFPTHRQAAKWGARWLDVTVYDYAD
jgi:3D (Asp-Asp-Asp) domain-containing protein